jgi:hypothetical protein
MLGGAASGAAPTEQAMNRDDPLPEAALGADGRMLVHWMIGRQSIWIQVAPDGALTVNGEPVTRVVPRACRGTRPSDGRARAASPAASSRPAARHDRLVESAP